MAELPERLLFTHNKKKYTALHGAASGISKFIWSVDEDTVFDAEIGLLGDVDVVLAGHSGIAFEKTIAGTRWINAGAIGMPENNGAPETRFVVIDDHKIDFKTLSYDNYWAASQMQAVGLLGGYHNTLITGYWPSQDVLPLSLRH